MPNRRVSRLLASAVLLAAPQAALAVIFQSTGDINFNTAAPTGDYANSGWQYQFDLGVFLGTPVGPNHYLAAAHTAVTVGSTFTYNGVNYNTTQLVQDYGDLRLLRVDNTFYSYAPLYETADGSEIGDEMVVFGRGTQRGSPVIIGGTERGWNWGAIDGVRRWGTNVVADAPAVYGGQELRFDFDLGAGPNEAVLSDKDSSGGVFINVNGQWKLAGINHAVTGPYSEPPSGAGFVAALYNTTGLVNQDPGSAGVIPSGAYASRVSPNAANIKAHLGLPPTWKNRNGGNWATAANWSNLVGNVVPNAVDAIADFRTVIDANQNVTYNGTITVGTLEFDNPGAGYTITPGAVSSSQLHLDVASGEARVNVAAGTHSVGSVYLDDATRFHIIEPTAKLTLNAFHAQGQAITKTGAGTLQANQLLAGVVTVSQGTIKIAPGTSTGTGKVTGVSVATGAGAKLDLTTTDLIVANTTIGSKSGSAYTGLQGLIQQGSANGSWTGPGINSSSAAAASGLTTLGIARAGDVLAFGGGATTQLWSGQTVTANDALIAYTYAGDANLDGFISGDDYSAIDFNIATPGASGYANGDFNYDGTISGDDYSMIDFNIVAQGADLITSGSASLSGVSAVPEPTALTLVGFASMAVASRRRRR